MINSPIYVFDSIGSRFSILNNDFLIGQSLSGYNTLTDSHIGSYIPYLTRNGKKWEIGVGLVKKSNNAIIVERTKVVQSSSSNKIVDFGTDFTNSEFYIFANQFGFDTGFNNVVVKNSDFKVDRVQSIYLIDTENKNISASLPKAEDSENLIVQFKLISDNNVLYIRNHSDNIVLSLSSNDPYAVFACDGNKWHRLNSIKSPTDFSSLSDTTFSTLADPSGDDLSFQYKNGTDFAGANFYYGTNNELLLGSDSSSTAHAIIPVTGTGDTIFNADNQDANFIIEGSGSRNFFFDYRGRIGLNIPSGSTPSTILHIINSTCREGIRLENRTSCHPTNVTLYYKPSSSLSANETIGQIKLSAKDTNGNQTDFAQLESISMSNTAGSPKGHFNLTVATSDVDGTGIKTIQTNPDLTIIGYSGNNNLTINKDGSSQIGYSGANVSVTSTTVSVTGSSIVLNGPVNFGSNTVTSNGSILANTIQANSLKLQGISEGSILSVDSSGYAVAGSDVRLPNIGSGYVLTTTSDGSITGIYNTNDYFLTNGDVLWNKYQNRDCSIALRQITFTDTDVSIDEYSIGDQIEVDISGTKYYRDIEDIEVSNNVVVSLLVNQNITNSTIEIGTASSVTKGGFLSIGRNVDDGTVADATSNTISIRPGTDTVFNASQQNINFSVYGIDEQPALKIQANAGVSKAPSGTYHAFASIKTTCEPCDVYTPVPDVEAFQIVASTGGVGLSNAHVSANFDYAATGIFSGMLLDVGTNGLSSYYGTYDQNGNAAEWVEDNNPTSTNDSQYVAGGSWKTEHNDIIGASGLKSIMSMTRTDGYEEVGFRIASLYNLTDSDYVSGDNGLSLNFVPVDNPKNLSDENILYLYNYSETNDPDVDDTYFDISIDNLGTVNKNYRIGKYEVTNAQYVQFLNSVATVNDRDLYKSQMTSSDRGGITRTGDGSSTPYEYAVKANMENKPVVFVDYISSIRFINWLHNGATSDVITESDVDSHINYGAYDIFSLGNNSYVINKNIYQKYWLPSIHEWHKAAYYEPVNGTIEQGSSSVMVKRNDPYVVATGYDPDGQVCTTLANLSVSGWLYVDHIIVGDGTIRSAKKFANCGDVTTDTGTTTPTTGDVFDNDNTNTGGGTTTCIGDDCPDVGAPSVGGGTIGDTGDQTDDACSGDDPPWWCDPNNSGPTWF